MNQCVMFFQDLKYIYGRYIDPSSQDEKNMYVKTPVEASLGAACVSPPSAPPPSPLPTLPAISDSGNLSLSLKSF